MLTLKIKDNWNFLTFLNL